MISLAAIETATRTGLAAGFFLTLLEWCVIRRGVTRDAITAGGYGKIAILVITTFAIWSGGMTAIALVGMWINTFL